MTDALDKIKLPEAVSSEEVGIITFNLKDEWLVEDFSSFLRQVNYVYDSLNKFWFVSEKDTENENTSANNTDRDDSIFGNGDYYYDEDFEEMLRRIKFEDYEISLTLNQIHLASPGIAEFIGNLNPLKIIADFITNWRAENTKRRDALTRAELDLFVAKTERLKFLVERYDKLSAKAKKQVDVFLAQTFLNPQFEMAEISYFRQLESVKVKRIN